MSNARVMRAAAGLAALLCLLPGCARTLGYAGAHPGAIQCKGKATISGTGSVAIGAGAGGAGTDAWTLVADCSENGFSFSQGPQVVPAAKPSGQ